MRLTGERLIWVRNLAAVRWQHVLVAEVGVELEVSIRDLAAVQVIVEEAEGGFTDVTGARRPDGGWAISSNGRPHAKGVHTFGH